MSKPQLDMILQMLEQQPDNSNATIAEMREGLEQLATMFPVDPDILCELVDVAEARAELIKAPNADKTRAILYLHGGGYVAGSINVYRAHAGRISRASEAHVLLPDYRLAPENPFPAAVDDAVSAYRWLLAKGYTSSRIAIIGDSAGGGLTVATLMAIRDAKLSPPACAVCLSPWVDLECDSATMQSKASEDPILTKDAVKKFADFYLNGQSARTPLASPIFGDFSGLPPLLIQVGSSEILLDDSKTLEAKAKQAGVQVTLEVWDSMIHVWQVFAPILDEGQQAIDKIGAFVQSHKSMA